MDPLRTMFRHHAWATAQLIDHCDGLPAERLQETIPGTYGTILATLTHIVGADQRYLARMTQEQAKHPVREDQEVTLAGLRDANDESARRWDALVDRAPELNVTLAPFRDIPETPRAEDLLFLQAIHHGNDHRTHICSILGAEGQEVPDVSGWAYWYR
jgi:uncharacterized damage-inducible protein DinB